LLKKTYFVDKAFPYATLSTFATLGGGLIIHLPIVPCDPNHTHNSSLISPLENAAHKGILL